MSATSKDPESWRRLVLHSMPKPAWLNADSPDRDVVLSSRTRIMRNLTGHKFVHRSSPEEMISVMERVLRAAEISGLNFEVFKSLTSAERDYLVGYRLVSPEFEWTKPGRAILVNPERTLSVMINEEDHLRIQSLTGGWSAKSSMELASRAHRSFENALQFAQHPDYGYLAASPFNTGAGRRVSAMFHLIGLATARRLPSVMKALSAQGLVIRGLFGESSRAIGAFVQVSVLKGELSDFNGACEYLIKEERQARLAVGREVQVEKSRQALQYAISSRALSLADSLRILAWVRWAASTSCEFTKLSILDVDELLTTLELRDPRSLEESSQIRSEALRQALS